MSAFAKRNTYAAWFRPTVPAGGPYSETNLGYLAINVPDMPTTAQGDDFISAGTAEFSISFDSSEHVQVGDKLEFDIDNSQYPGGVYEVASVRKFNAYPDEVPVNTPPQTRKRVDYAEADLVRKELPA